LQCESVGYIVVETGLTWLSTNAIWTWARDGMWK